MRCRCGKCASIRVRASQRSTIAWARGPMSASSESYTAVLGFFFSSRRRHTRWNCDWSSDVCSSDLAVAAIRDDRPDLVLLDVQMPRMDGFDVVEAVGAERMPGVIFVTAHDQYAVRAFRSEERRVGKECRSRWWPKY